MNLKCKINEKVYDIVQGATFAEEYNETLDSGSIMIMHVKEIKDLCPFDDVYVWGYDGDSTSETSDFYGYDSEGNVVNSSGTKILDFNGDVIDGATTKIKFYKHLLVDQYVKEIIRFGSSVDSSDEMYNYKIQLFSETKALEMIQLPNISITQPLKANKKKTIWEYVNNFVEMYSPKIKIGSSDGTWKYVQKYSVDSTLQDKLKNMYSPDFSLNTPTLKDLLAQLFNVCDLIPCVKNRVISYIDISERKGTYTIDTTYNNYITQTRTSDDEAVALRTQYSNALSQDNTTRLVEYMGFRNSDESLLTIGNMRVETSFPIYKINKFYVCYYKVVSFKDQTSLSATEQTKVFLCRQDITKLILLDNIRNMRTADWTINTDKTKSIMSLTLDELANNKIYTLGYTQGSNYISGWGTSYSYPVGFLTKNKTYIQNIIDYMDAVYPYGVDGYENVCKSLGFDPYTSNYYIYFKENVDCLKSDFTAHALDVYSGAKNWVQSILNDANLSLKLKGLLFEVDYDAYYNGTVIQTKDNDTKDDIVQMDNSSSSLSILEKNGLFQKEKINRLGNATYQLAARYDSYSEMSKLNHNLGAVCDSNVLHASDVVIYHKEISIYDNYILGSYTGVKNYVLKNYFNSVFAKYRLYNLMSYSESTTRSENKHLLMQFSKKHNYYEDINYISPLSSNELLKKLCTCFKSNSNGTDKKISEVSEISTIDKINYALIGHNGNYYMTDFNLFISGKSLCVNLKMIDNVSIGTYIDNPYPFYGEKSDYFSIDVLADDVTDDVSGSIQKLNMIVDDYEVGFNEKMDFILGHTDAKIINYDTEDNVKKYYQEKILKYPRIVDIDTQVGTGNEYIGNYDYVVNKDNKEKIDMTFQIEPIMDDDNVIIGPNFLRLSDINSNYIKTDVTYSVIKNDDTYLFSNSSVSQVINNLNDNLPLIRVRLPQKMDVYTENKDYELENLNFEWQADEIDTVFDTYGSGATIKLSFKVDSISSDYTNNPNRLALNISNIKYSLCTSALLNSGSYIEDYTVSGNKTIYLYTPKKFAEDYKNRTYMDLTEETLDNLSLFQINDYCDGVNTMREFITILDKTDLKDLLGTSGDKNTVLRAIGYNNILKYPLDVNTNNTTIITSEYYKVYQYVLETLPQQMPKNMFIIYSKNTMSNPIIYEEKSEISSTISVEETLSLVQNDKNSYINVNLKDITDEVKNNKSGSIQYWYLDSSDGKYKFVFGVNLTSTDITNGYVKVYLSLLMNRDTRVYDSNHNVVGTNHNYVDNKNKKFATEQYYD